ncbi:MAG: DUF4920 domain-containing protein [Deltaproteobacteria bacterium]|nr:DUF4920 domain-containing protein [Deltaproteobacteria bacterium]MBW2399625.1 DUF4920 domain-containing protein [Deltaproteobacteria bacterium]MBW2666538.1 DUF4920 domain-containing protein [Deltaproteobacteria bacterium]
MLTARTASLILFVLVAAFESAAGAPSPIPPGSDFGAGLTLSEPTPLAEVVRAPEKFEARPVLLHGRISDVCQRKGCWVVLRDGGEQVRVRFHDYSFFLPTDAAGSEAFVEGLVKVEELSQKAARHYAKESVDGDPDSITGPQREVGFTATGVRLLRAP